MPTDVKIKLGVIGLGLRGQFLLSILLNMDSVEIAAICDPIDKRLARGNELIGQQGAHAAVYADYKALLARSDIEAVIICTTWNTHVRIAIDAMRAGKHAAMEVGGAASLEECWRLVRTSEETEKYVMLLENICYADIELSLLHMERQGLFGELIHLQGGYQHDLREEIALGRENQHGRLNHYLHRNGELYPTHQLGPIAKMLRINRGNRFLTLTSMASKARGLNKWIRENKGEKYDLASAVFEQGDVVTTQIKCAHGETVLLVHDTTLPRPYSRNGRVQGTNGIWMEDGGVVYIEHMTLPDYEQHPYDPHQWEPYEQYRIKYQHPLWKSYEMQGVQAGHGGVDYLVLQAFVESIRTNTPPPIDVYDAAVWMSITCLSEQSVAMGSMPVPVPDFTSGGWVDRKAGARGKYSLDEVCFEFFDD
ncbi:Gfo/Idh/MocA family protein [Paenibacillus sp. OV219]|uniref:Gfo/Idh/MocA family protein n=1 Tax=Paenibacillus sp. OV219 TaxID=1884377 RepID=UPI000B89A059|nr:Gfo/Idh/MocA family oxidoreductase [Paenibacillus sp. OV219]